MNSILTAVIFVSLLGLVLGLILAFAGRLLAVPENEKAKELEAALAGANCGACGFSGCAGYAAALADGSFTDCGLCSPGGAKTAAALAEILGLEAGSQVPMAAVVLCQGGKEACGSRMEYKGLQSCKAANQLFQGGKACAFGCLGLGDCVQACPYGAIRIAENGVAKVDPAVCRACKICVGVCPKGLITLLPKCRQNAAVLCKNTSKGAETRKACTQGCLGCGKCQRSCPAEAIAVENFLAKVDPDKCIGCGKCAEGCPAGSIRMLLS